MTAGAGSNKKGGSRLAITHPNLFTYADNIGPASSVPPSYIALGRACVAEDPLQRPTFDEVLSALEGMQRDAERMKEEAALAAAATTAPTAAVAAPAEESGGSDSGGPSGGCDAGTGARLRR